MVAAKLRRVRRVSRRESSFLKAHARIPYKITVPSPVVFTKYAYAPGVRDKVYPTRAALAHALAHIIRDELLELVVEGLPYIQIDAPRYTQLADPVHRERVKQEGWDPDQAVDEAIAADRICLQAIRGPDRTVGPHLWRGNIAGRCWPRAGMIRSSKYCSTPSKSTGF